MTNPGKTDTHEGDSVETILPEIRDRLIRPSIEEILPGASKMVVDRYCDIFRRVHPIARTWLIEYADCLESGEDGSEILSQSIGYRLAESGNPYADDVLRHMSIDPNPFDPENSSLSDISPAQYIEYQNLKPIDTFILIGQLITPLMTYVERTELYPAKYDRGFIE
jgi:hypothetical protein